MTEQERLIRRLQIWGLVVMLPTVAFMWGRDALGWFRYQAGADVWYYGLTSAGLAFFTGIQLLVLWYRTKAS